MTAAPDASTSRGAALHSERLWPTPWIFLSTALVIPASLLVFLPINIVAGVVSAIVLYGGCIAVLLLTSPVVEVTADEVRAGRARLPIRFAGTATAYFGADATQQRGPALDVRAWLVIRGWVSPVVRIELTDPADPAPYWLVSSRRPQSVVRAIVAAKSAGAGGTGPATTNAPPDQRN